MISLSDATVDRLRHLGARPEFASDRYTVIEEIGRGGMGTVYLALDADLGREVAIKIPNAIDSARADRRVQLEARAIARLEHPGIVPIHDVGTLADGRVFYVMKRVHGRTLRDHLQTVPDVSERLRIFERVCEPVRFAHAQGVIHRDLKPENIMIGAFGEVMVMDWGAAKTSFDDRADDPGEQPAVIGTRGFMAPEQARGADSDIDERADVYGLGAILHLLLTGDVPSADAAPAAGLRRRRLPRPLAAICVKALAPSAGDRYASVAALADDVARYRTGQAVAAYRESPFERAARFSRTYRTPILLVVGYIVMRAAVAFLAGW